MKKYLWFLLPIPVVVLMCVFNFALSLISEPNDIAVIAGVSIICVEAILIAFIVPKIFKSHKTTKKNEKSN